jgi:hypothetical protein
LEQFQSPLCCSAPPSQADEGEYAANSGYHAANTAVGQTEDQMYEATIGALANLATATAIDRGIVATLTEANARIANQLEERSK